jgi:hypothetical protein
VSHFTEFGLYLTYAYVVTWAEGVKRLVRETPGCDSGLSTCVLTCIVTVLF